MRLLRFHSWALVALSIITGREALSSTTIYLLLLSRPPFRTVRDPPRVHPPCRTAQHALSGRLCTLLRSLAWN